MPGVELRVHDDLFHVGAGGLRAIAHHLSNAITAGDFCYRRGVPITRADGSAPAGAHDELDALASRTALWTVPAAAVLVLVALLVSGGLTSAVYSAYSVALVAVAWLVFPPRGALLTTGLVIAAGAGLVAATARSWLAPTWRDGPAIAVWIATAGATALVGLVHWVETGRRRALHAALRAERERGDEARRRIAESERRYADVVAMAPGVVFELETRPDGTRAVSFISDSARHLFDVPPEAILADAGVLFRMIDPPSQLAAIDAAIARAGETLTPWELQGTIRTPAGHTKWIRGQATPERRGGGTVRWHGVFTDVTERTRTELALRESRTALKQSLSLMQGAFESTADGLLVVDAAGRVSAFNQKFLALWRVPTVIASTRDDAQLLAHVLAQLEFPDAFLARVRELYSQPDAVSFDTVAFKDGRRYERYSQPQVVDGAVVGRVWSFRDVTARLEEERRRTELEQQLQQAQTLEALGTLAGSIAGDFNNLITIILTHAEQAACDSSDEARQASLDAVMRAGRRAGALVREIREFSEPRPVEREVLAAAAPIARAVQLLRATVPPSIEIVERLDRSVTMFASATQVQQVVTNLLINAAQSIGERAGRVTVELDEVGADDVPAATPRPLAERYARLVVADTGEGPPAGAAPRVFDPFWSTRPVAGSGLGVAVVQGLVRRYHGDVEVQSAPGQGTTFRVYWPALPPAAADAALAGALQPAADAAAGRRILVVDDEADIVRVVSVSLRRLGYIVTAATDPRDALATFVENPSAVDAVLIDLAMPHLTGVDLGRRMLALRPETPMVLFTGYAADLGPDEARTIGFQAVLHKPVTLSGLAEALHRVLDGRPHRTTADRRP
jgi:signal transduction histidine kinase/ActR/RegA family two-component response regulator